MTRKELADNIAITIREYIGNHYTGTPELKLKITPEPLFVAIVTEDEMLADIEEANEWIEDASAAERAESEEYTDYQVSRNPDFYPIKNLIEITSGGIVELDKAEISKIAEKYCAD
ncbi:MAG: hypothetical protein NC248_10505 [Bacteroides sp.]|nr:hypothetical protein [Bacteroides sp.]